MAIRRRDKRPVGIPRTPSSADRVSRGAGYRDQGGRPQREKPMADASESTMNHEAVFGRRR